MKAFLRITLFLASLASIRLHAQPLAVPGLSNTSALATLSPGGIATLGFVVSPQSTQPMTALIRTIGPSLSTFGIKNPAPLPHLRLFDSRGNDITRTAYLAPVPWDSFFSFAGAFPLTGGERPILAYNVASVSPGTYTVQASDDSGTGGTVLIEVYLFSGNFSVPPI